MDPRISFAAISSELQARAEAQLDEQLDWLDGHLRSFREQSEILRNSRSTNTASWSNLMKSPARKRVKDNNHPASSPFRAAYEQEKQEKYSGPISSLSYASTQNKNSIFAGPPSFTNNGNAILRSPGKHQGLKSLVIPGSPISQNNKVQQQQQQQYGYDGHHEDDKENSVILLTQSGKKAEKTKNSAVAAAPGNNGLNTSSRSPGAALNASTASNASAATRSPIRSPLQSSTSRAQKQQTQGTGSGPVSPASQKQHQQQNGYLSPLTRSQQHQAQSPKSSHPSAPASPVRQNSQHSPSPTPRPASRTAVVPNTSAATKQNTPVRIVDNVFTLAPVSSVAAAEEDQDRPITPALEDITGEDEEDDEEEIENILLGYTKTPATAPGKKGGYKSDALLSIKAKQTEEGGEVQVEKDRMTIKVSAAEKALPAVPQKSPPLSAATRPSPPRPTKSPARAAPNFSSQKPTTSATSNPITQTLKLGLRGSPIKSNTAVTTNGSSNNSPSKWQIPRSYSPMKRDMSNLASIASVLGGGNGSPTKQAASSIKTSNVFTSSRPPSPQPGSTAAAAANRTSRVPVPQASGSLSVSNSPAGTGSRPRSPAPAAAAEKASLNTRGNFIGTPTKASTAKQAAASPNTSPQPSRISSRIAALAKASSPKLASLTSGGGKHSNTTSPSSSRPVSPARLGLGLTTSPRLGLTRSPRLKNSKEANEAPSMTSHGPTTVAASAGVAAAPAQDIGDIREERSQEEKQDVGAATAVGPSTSSQPKAKRPLLSPIQSPNSQRSLALSSLRKAIPDFGSASDLQHVPRPPPSPGLQQQSWGRTNSTASTGTATSGIPIPQGSPRLPATLSRMPAALQKPAAAVAVEEKAVPVETVTKAKDEALLLQHQQAIEALSAIPQSVKAKTAVAAESPKQTTASPCATKKVTGLSPPAKSPLRKQNSMNALSAQASTSPAAKIVEAAQNTITEEETTKSVTVKESARDEEPASPEPAARPSPPPSTITKSESSVPPTTQHRDTVVNVNVPPSPLFSTFLSNNKRTSTTLSFAGLPGRGLGIGREKSLGLGLGKSLGSGSMRAANNAATAQAEDSEQQASNATLHNARQSFYSTLASQGRKRLSSTLSGGALNEIDSQGSASSKASRTDFAHTARASIVAAQQANAAGQPISQSARFEQLRNRISNIKGTSGSVGFPLATSRASLAAQNFAHSASVPAFNLVSKLDGNHESRDSKALFSPPPAESTKHATLPSSATVPTIQPATTSASSFAAAIASFVPAPSFSASFANFFGASTSPSKTVVPEAKTDEKAKAFEVAAKSPLYPSLPSSTILKAAVTQNMADKQSEQVGDDDMEELASPEPRRQSVAEDIQDTVRKPEATVRHARSSSSSSVSEIVSVFEAKEAQLRQEMLTSPVRKISGQSQIMEADVAKKSMPRSTTPTFSPPTARSVPRNDSAAIFPLHHVRTSQVSLISSRPESRLSEFSISASTPGNVEHSLAGIADIEDPGLEPIMRATSEETEDTAALQTDDQEEVASETDGDDEPENTKSAQKYAQKANIGETENHIDLMASSSQPTASFKPSKPTTTNLSKSTFKPSRPVQDEASRPVHRAPSRAPSVTSLAPSRASSASIASTMSFNPSKSTANRKNNLGASTASDKAGLKSLQLAAVAAKKEQAEKDRKAAVKEERDQKRAALNVAKKQDHEQPDAKADKKRKDRDDTVTQNQSMSASTVAKGKAPAVPAKAMPVKKTDDELAKKRKVDLVEVVIPKPAVQKTTVARPAQPKPNPTTASTSSRPVQAENKAPAINAAHAKALASSSNMIGVTKQAAPPAARPPLQASTSRAPQQQALLSQHQQAILSATTQLGKIQPAVRQQAVARPTEPEVEPFQLPEIDSEYSDSDEEEQAKKAAARPVWTHSPDLRQALAVQANFDPDRLFGPIPTLRMEEIFREPGTMARLRHRTSSAHWSGPDAISQHEEKEYAKRMGFKRSDR